jgi:hypothetical protein
MTFPCTGRSIVMPIKQLLGASVLVATLSTGVASSASAEMLSRPAANFGRVMLILRGIANSENPRGQLDDQSALEYARRRGFRGEVLDVAGDTGADSPQVLLALERIRRDQTVTAIYGFSGGGYNARAIWRELGPVERGRIRNVIVIGSPDVARADFPGYSDVLIKDDPPEGHMAGPKMLLESLDR